MAGREAATAVMEFLYLGMNKGKSFGGLYCWFFKAF